MYMYTKYMYIHLCKLCTNDDIYHVCHKHLYKTKGRIVKIVLMK